MTKNLLLLAQVAPVPIFGSSIVMDYIALFKTMHSRQTGTHSNSAAVSRLPSRPQVSSLVPLNIQLRPRVQPPPSTAARGRQQSQLQTRLQVTTSRRQSSGRVTSLGDPGSHSQLQSQPVRISGSMVSADQDSRGDSGRGVRASDQTKLRNIIISHSIAWSWPEARAEWLLEKIYDQPGKCICGHPIVDTYQIINPSTSTSLQIGNVCIEQFPNVGIRGVRHSSRAQPSMSPPPGRMESKQIRLAMTSLKRLTADPDATANDALLSLTQKSECITAADALWYTRVTTGPGSRYAHDQSDARYSGKKSAIKERINRLILLGMSADRPCCCGGSRNMIPRRARVGRYFYTCPLYQNKNDKGCGAFRWA